MKILLVSWSVLPNKGGSSIIVENLARNFSNAEMIVLGSKQLFQNNSLHRPSTTARFEYFFSELSLFGRGARYFEWFRKWRFQPLVKAIKKMIRQEQIDYVIGIYPNDYYCHAACRAAQALQVPFSTYFHNTYIENTAIKNPRAKEIQAEIFDTARHIFVMSKGMEDFYKEKYQLDKFIPLVHTFNEYPDTKAMTGIPGTDKQRYQLVAIGNFNESNMEATRRFVDTIKTHPRFSLSLYTHVPKMLLKMRGLDVEAIDYKGFVDPDKVHSVLQNYDIMVLTHGFTGGYGPIEYQTIFPTRTIPLLLSGKPIIAHAPDHSFLNHFIKKNNCAALIEQADPQAILNTLDKVASDLDYQKQLVAAARETAAQFYGPEVARQLKKILNAS